MFLLVDLTRFHTLIKKLQQEAPAERAGEEEGEAGEEAETTTDVPENVSIRIIFFVKLAPKSVKCFHSRRN